MLFVVLGDATGREHLVLHGAPLPVRAHIVDLAIDPHHQRIARRLRDQLMKLLVPESEALAVAARSLHSLDRSVQTLDIAAGGVEYCKPHHVGFEPEAYLDELEGTGEIGDLLAAIARTHVDEGAGTEAPRHQLLGLEVTQGSADRGA